jgi:hypothetical protein
MKKERNMKMLTKNNIEYLCVYEGNAYTVSSNDKYTGEHRQEILNNVDMEKANKYLESCKNNVILYAYSGDRYRIPIIVVDLLLICDDSKKISNGRFAELAVVWYFNHNDLTKEPELSLFNGSHIRGFYPKKIYDMSDVNSIVVDKLSCSSLPLLSNNNSFSTQATIFAIYDDIYLNITDRSTNELLVQISALDGTIKLLPELQSSGANVIKAINSVFMCLYFNKRYMLIGSQGAWEFVVV